ncbi:MAG: hypothetical protein MJ241_02865 [Bacilli bacterium]|nr:hypothetical protein [Bacilli bacterium]
MSKSKNLIVLSAAMLLMACTPKPTPAPTSSSTTEVSKSEKSEEQLISSAITSNKTDESITSSVEPVIDGVTFDKFVKVITDAAYIEAKLSTGGTYKSVDTAGSISDTVEYTLDVYDDFSSYATGTVKETRTDGSKINEDSFIERKAIKASQFRDLGVVYDYTMLYSIKDYKNDSFVKNAYKDSVSRQIIDDDASQDGVINTTVAKWELTLQATNSVIAFFDQYFYSNMYVDQLGINSVHEDVTEENTIYTISAEYKVDGDLNDVITYHNELEVTMDKNKSRVLSYKTNTYSDDVSKINSADHYYSGTRTEVNIEYGEKDSAPVNVPNVENYFIHSIDSVNVLVDGNREVVNDLMQISPSHTFLFISPKAYSPASVLNVNEQMISPFSSSDESIVKISGVNSSNPHFEIVGTGTVTLTFSYLGRDEKGVWCENLGTVDVRISDTVLPDDVYVQKWKGGELFKEDKYEVGTEYKYVVSFSSTDEFGHSFSSKVSQEYTVESSDNDALPITKDDRNNVYFTPKKEGTYKITITSTENPEVQIVETIEVVDNTKIDYAAVLTSHSWTYVDKNSKQYTNVLRFEKDGTGSLTQTVVGTVDPYVDTFNWSLEGNNLTLSNWSYIPKTSDLGYFYNAVISADLMHLECTMRFDNIPWTYTANE